MSERESAASIRAALIKRAGLTDFATRPAVREALLAGLGGGAAIGLLAACAWASVTPLIIAPFGATCVLLFTLPSVPLAQPRNVIAGHILSAMIGLAVLAMMGSSPGAMAVGVGAAIFAMRLTRTIHPPAGANPIVIIASGASWWFVAVPVAAGAVLLVLFAWLYHRFVSGAPYPAR